MKHLATTGHDPEIWRLFRAIASHDRAAVRRLLAEAPALARQAAKVGATREAAADCYFAEIGHYAYGGDTPLHLAAAAHDREVVEDLVSKGADVRARNRRGAEPLHYAADGSPDSPAWDPDEQFAVVRFLIEAGADPDADNKDGVTPLHRAVRTRCTGAVRALLEGGADLRKRNKSGSTPLHLAVQYTGRGGSGSARAREEQAAIVRLLLTRGARWTDEDRAGKAVRDSASAGWIRAMFEER